MDVNEKIQEVPVKWDWNDVLCPLEQQQNEFMHNLGIEHAERVNREVMSRVFGVQPPDIKPVV